jgi:hypothetical protein
MFATAIWGVFAPAAWIGRFNASLLLMLTSGLLVLGIVRWIQGYRIAAIYVFAHGWMVLGTLAFTAMLLGLLPDVWLTRHGILWGSITELSLLAFAFVATHSCRAAQPTCRTGPRQRAGDTHEPVAE